MIICNPNEKGRGNMVVALYSIIRKELIRRDQLKIISWSYFKIAASAVMYKKKGQILA
jgi:hypothetical protein